MRTILFLSIFIMTINVSWSQQKEINIVVIGAHPDDADGSSGGTAIKFAEQGHNVLFVSLTNGDAGHFEKGGGHLAQIRRAEAKEAGRRFGVTYKVLDYHDGELMPTLNVRLDVIRIIRDWKADIVIGPRPNDYHPDHRNTAIVIQDAAYLVMVPNIAPDTPALKKNPLFIYTQDRFKKPYPFIPDIAIDISDVFHKKYYAMAAHASQYFEWLPWLDNKLDIVPKTDLERVEWLKVFRKKHINDDVRQSLVKWYGKDKADKITDAEAFEICEYGRQPNQGEIKELFPMLGN
ncbi:MAG: PIG-L family deacetylase [Dysgonamonadaceae bacterium]|nr:PIG-L family deacetylase [Dysgonamonadaceae bacterium]MDD4730081.1 PIG-L family deacetylase [Dysgonamonadaceae bacterium]